MKLTKKEIKRLQEYIIPVSDVLNTEANLNFLIKIGKQLAEKNVSVVILKNKIENKLSLRRKPTDGEVFRLPEKFRNVVDVTPEEHFKHDYNKFLKEINFYRIVMFFEKED